MGVSSYWELMQGVIPDHRLLRWLALYGYLRFSFWEEKLVAPLIATPNVDKCNRRQTRKVKGLGYVLLYMLSNCTKLNILRFADKLDKVLVQIMLMSRGKGFSK